MNHQQEVVLRSTVPSANAFKIGVIDFAAGSLGK